MPTSAATRAAAQPDPTTVEPTTADPATAARSERGDKQGRIDPAAQASTRNDHKGPRRADKKPEPKKSASTKSEPAHVDTERTDRAEVAASPRNDKKHSGRSTQDVKSEAGALYRAKNFSGAANLLTSSLSSFGSDDAQELKNLAAVYSQLGKAYSVGMAPGTKPTDAFAALRRAINLERDVGSVYLGDLQERLASVAPRAAASFMAAKEYESAFQAVRQSESLGGKSTSNQTVRTMLENLAGDLLRSAQSDLATDPEGAKKKLRQILGIVDAKHPLAVKAQKLLNGS